MARILLRVMDLAPMLLYKWPFKRHILGYMVCFCFSLSLSFEPENFILFFSQKVELNVFMNLL
jgi:hypothetical protein